MAVATVSENRNSRRGNPTEDQPRRQEHQTSADGCHNDPADQDDVKQNGLKPRRHDPAAYRLRTP
jgi:hypothetical protein